MKAQIITPWTGDGKAQASAFRPLLADRYPLQAWTDVTGSDGGINCKRPEATNERVIYDHNDL
jgi:hypothetical protein